MRTLDPDDLLFIFGFVAVFCFGIGGFVYLSAPPSLPGFIDGLVTMFLGFGVVFLIIGLLGAGILFLTKDRNP